MLDKIDNDGKVKTVAETIMEAKFNGIPLFVGVEQGSGKNLKHTYVYFKGSMSIEARD